MICVSTWESAGAESCVFAIETTCIITLLSQAALEGYLGGASYIECGK